MRLVPTPIACKLTGLSTERLREWTSRRALIAPDAASLGKGRPAHFSWRTVLVLRLAVVLREQFAIELEHHRAGVSELRAGLDQLSFIALWGRRVALGMDGRWTFLDPDIDSVGDALLLRLDPHLAAIRDGFGLASAPPPNQLDLFALSGIRRDDTAMSFSSAARAA